MVKEVEGYLAILKDLRGQVKSLLQGLSPSALDWQPIKSEGDLATNSIGALTAHLAGSENFWMKEIIGGQSIQRNRDAEFVSKGMGAPELIARLEAAAGDTERILPSLTATNLEETRKNRDRTVTVRWAILHVIEHTAMHVGHMQLTRQLWINQHGK